MSGDTSPILGLRSYRIQKKPQLSHNPNNSELNSSSELSPEPKPTIKKRIINPISDSDSEIESTNSVETKTLLNGDDAGYASKARVTDEVISKEKQMKYLSYIFPNVDAMTVHQYLGKHKFDTKAVIADMATKYPHKENYQSFDQWLITEEQKQTENKVRINNVIYEQKRSFKRKAESEPRVAEKSTTSTSGTTIATKKKKVKCKRRMSYDSDDSRGSHDYKDSRVYDSDEDSDVELSDELTGDKKRVLDFFQTATINELQLMSTCSKKKAEVIIQNRPYTGWIDLVTKLQNSKLNTDLLNAAQQVIITRNNIRQLMKRCTSLAAQLERAIAMGAGVKQQPRNLSSTLKLTGYQMVGLNWLAVLHHQGVNGILADEMGLGKTVQIISFLAYLKETNQAKNTHLVIVPSSTLDNWKNEFARWCPEIRVFMYSGSSEERRAFRFDLAKGMLKEFDVILTTYTMVANSPEERKMFRITPMHYVIFDEAHMLKNMNTQRYENLIKINAKHRILLTGTPLQNNLLELMSLLIFVMPKIFAEKADDLKSLFQKSSKSKEDENVPAFEREQIEQAKRIMKPFVLRRLKSEVLQDLPKKYDHVVHVKMVPTQKERYEALVAAYKNIGEDNEQPQYNGMSIMTDLRKLSNHPLLMRYHYDLDQLSEIATLLAKDPGYKDTIVQYIIDDLVWMSDFEIHTMCNEFRCLNKYTLPDNLILNSGKFVYLDKLLLDLKREGHRVLIFSQYVIMLNVMEEYLKFRNHKYLRLDGSTPVNIRQDLINQYTDNKDIFIFMLSTKAGGLGINLTSADTVIIHDIDFNPYNDKQAEDRCHRMGQIRPVSVYRLISEGTIEEGMLAMNKEKLKLEKEITTDESDNPDVKSVVNLLSSALGIDHSKATNLVSPKKPQQT